MRVLGLDVGEVRIGIAVSDELGLAAHGLPTLQRVSWTSDSSRLKKFVRQYAASQIVVGLPRNMDGSLGRQGEIISDFIRRLRQAMADISIVSWDERLTTRAAERTLLEADLSREKRKKKIDQVSATIILQGYLDHLSGREPVDLL